MDLVRFLKIRAEKYEGRPLLYGGKSPKGSVIGFRCPNRSDRFGLEKWAWLREIISPSSIPTVPQTLIAYYSIIKAGGVVIPINPIYTPREITFILNNSEARALILHESFIPIIEEIKTRSPGVKNFIVRKDPRRWKRP